jgi:hypothetical protein
MIKEPTSAKVDIGGTESYRPGPDLRNGARVLRELAVSPTIKGSRYLLIGSLVFTAFCVEAFCQAYGKQILGEELWVIGDRSKKKPKPAERWPVLDKLKAMGRSVDVPVNYGSAPWRDISLIVKARDELAHARPELRSVRVNGVDNDADYDAVFRAELTKKYEPLLEAERLGLIAGRVDQALKNILHAAGQHGYEAEIMASSSWGAHLADGEA